LNHEIEFGKSIDWRVARAGSVSHLWGYHLHYHEFLEEAGSDELQAIVLDWIAKNPPYGERYWFDAWSSYAVSLRAVVWMQQIDRRRGSFRRVSRRREPLALRAGPLPRGQPRNRPARQPPAQELEGAAVRGTLPRNVGRAALAAAGGGAPGTRARRADPAGRRALRAFARYHGQVFADLLECKQAAGPGPLATRLDAHLAGMAQALADLTHPDGLPSLFNDGGLHMGYRAGSAPRRMEARAGRRNPPADPRSGWPPRVTSACGPATICC
jgi:hypothetical protein